MKNISKKNDAGLIIGQIGNWVISVCLKSRCQGQLLSLYG